MRIIGSTKKVVMKVKILAAPQMNPNVWNMYVLVGEKNITIDRTVIKATCGRLPPK